MGVSFSIKGFSDKSNEEYKKHYEAVKFCVANELSYPVETSAFFKGKVEGDYDLEDINTNYVLEEIENGVEVVLPIKELNEEKYELKVSDIPEEVHKIIISLS